MPSRQSAIVVPTKKNNFRSSKRLSTWPTRRIGLTLLLLCRTWRNKIVIRGKTTRSWGSKLRIANMSASRGPCFCCFHFSLRDWCSLGFICTPTTFKMSRGSLYGSFLSLQYFMYPKLVGACAPGRKVQHGSRWNTQLGYTLARQYARSDEGMLSLNFAVNSKKFTVYSK